MPIDSVALEARRKLARRIRELRMKLNWTQQELADAAEMAMRHIQRLESNKPSAIELDSIIKISKAFHITAADLLDF